MKHHLNTLFVTTQGSYLAREGQAVLVRVEKQTKLRVPVHTLGGIVCFGRIGVSPSLMGLCGEGGPIDGRREDRQLPLGAAAQQPRLSRQLRPAHR